MQVVDVNFVDDRGEGPVDPHRAGFCPGDDTRGARALDVAQRAQRRRRGQLGEPGDLLRGPALQVRTDQQRAVGAATQLRCQRGDRLAVAAE